MSKVKWRPQLNALTTPQSYKAQPVPNNTFGYDGIAKRIALKNPVINAGLAKATLELAREVVKEELVNGNQVSLENFVTWHLSIATRLDAADAPLPPADEIVRAQVYASRTFADEVRQAVELERLPPSKKVPVIAGADDTVLRLSNVLNPNGLLRLSGTNLFFDPDDADTGCLIEGTRSGKTVQTRFGPVSNSEVLVMPDVPAQNDPWNNEYLVSIMTQYTENGTLRTGTYGRPLRTPLEVTLGNGDGILSGANRNPLVTVTGGTLDGDNAQLRIQAVLDTRSGELRLNLLDMRENGAHGDVVTVSGNGAYTLPGFAGSALNGLEVTVDNITDLENLIRTNYGGRLVDILNVQGGA